MAHHTPRLFSFFGALAFAFALLGQEAGADVVINEIMYRPGTAFPENTNLEYIELRNNGVAPEDLSGWSFTSGVAYTFPVGATIPAGGYVVVSANPAVLQATYGISGVFGPWAAGASLSDKDENIRISKPGTTPGTFDKVDEVHYASEGDWADTGARLFRRVDLDHADERVVGNLSSCAIPSSATTTDKIGPLPRPPREERRGRKTPHFPPMSRRSSTT